VPDHDLAADTKIVGALGERFKMVFSVVGDGGAFGIWDPRRLRSGHILTFMGVKKYEIRAKLDGLRQSKAEGLFIGGNLRGEEDCGGLAPTWLEDCGHGDL
jgi:hypothetical protein